MINIKRTDLLTALGLAALACDRRNTIPILSAVALSSDEPGLLTLKCGNLDQEVTVTVPCEGKFDQPVCLLGHREMAAMLRALGGDLVSLDASKPGKMEVRVGAIADAELNTLPYEDFPHLGHVGALNSFSAGADIINAMRSVSCCISTEETRYYLNGIYLEGQGKWGLKVTATDGHKLMTIDLQAPDQTGKVDESGIIIPRRTCGMVLGQKFGDKPVKVSIGRKLASNEPAPTSMGGGSSTVISFEWMDGACRILLMSKLIDGTFPNYSLVIPQEPEKGYTCLRVKASELRRAINAACGLITEKTRAIKLEASGRRLTVSVASPENGRLQVQAECEGADIAGVGYNANYLRTILDAIGGENVDLTWSNFTPADPTRIVNPMRPEAVAVLMPMRV